MDRYLFVLDALRRDDYRRLRRFVDHGSGKFSTWLIVVARRLCLDEYRHRYGRPQSDEQGSLEQRQQRRKLADLVGSELELLTLEAAPSAAPDEVLHHADLKAAIEHVLADLDPTDRLILRMRFEDGLSIPEVARLVDGNSPFRMYRRLARVLADVRVRLERAGIRSAVE